MTEPLSTSPFRRKSVWQREGLCVDAEASLREKFSDFRGGRPSKDDERKTLCAECPVRAECLAFAIVHDEYGIWGGTTKGEREKAPANLKSQLMKKAIAEDWFLPLKSFLPSVDYNTQSEKTEIPLVPLEEVHHPLDEGSQRLPFLRHVVPAFVL